MVSVMANLVAQDPMWASEFPVAWRDIDKGMN